MTKVVTYALPVNPEPWVVGNAYVARGGGKSFARIAPDKTLTLYQGAVRAELEALGAEVLPGLYELDLFFFRQNAQYTDTIGRTRTRNTPDTTNIQKATEDALQGVLIGNDRDVVRIQSHRVAAGVDVDPMVVIRLTFGLEGPRPARQEVQADVDRAIQGLSLRQKSKIDQATEANVWRP